MLRNAFFGALTLTFVLLAGCAGVAPEKRHSPAEIAAYTPKDFVAPIASEAVERSEFNEGIAKVERALAAPLGTEFDASIEGAMGAIKLFNVDRAKSLALVTRAMNELVREPNTKSLDYQRSVLSTAHALFANETAAQALTLVDVLTTPRQFAIAAYTALRGADSPSARARIDQAMRQRFGSTELGLMEPRLRALQHVLQVDTRAELRLRPSLVDLLAAPLREGKPVVVSFQRRDRQRFGLAVVRGADGRFVRNADGSMFAIPHLANALTDLPGTITNGNTPQGLFTIVGAGTATNKWIGPTPYLESKVPIEASTSEFEHTSTDAVWDEARYESYLPASWRTYFPFKEAWLAGQAGRDEMLLHGTTINREYYAGAKFYPGTPSAGCLVATETWAKEDGRLQSSDQLSLIKAFTRDGIDRGYLIVVELDDAPRSVQLAEVMADITEAELRLSAARVARMGDGAAAGVK